MELARSVWEEGCYLGSLFVWFDVRIPGPRIVKV